MKVLNYIKIKNFLGTTDRIVHFSDYNSPLFVVGQNTGGKTTIMRAVFFALTGEDAFFKGRNLDSLINDNAEKMELELSIDNRGSTYIINVEKTLNKSLNISITGEDGPLIDGKKLNEAKEKLSQIFGNPSSLLNTYFLFGDNNNDFVSATPTQRLNTIVSVSDNFKRYDEISNNAKKMAVKLEVDKNKVIGTLEFLDTAIETKKEQIEEIKEEISNIDNRKKSIEDNNIFDIVIPSKQQEQANKINKIIEIKKSIKEKEDSIKDLKTQNIEEIKNKIQNHNKNKSANEKITNEKNQVVELKYKEDKQKSEITNNLTKVEGDIKTKSILKSDKEKRIVEVNEDILNLFSFSNNQEIIDFKNNKEADKNRIENEGSDLKNKISILESKNKDKATELVQLDKKLEETNDLFKHNTQCPLCYNELTDKSLSNYKDYLDKDKKSIENTISENNKEISSLSEKRKTLLENWKVVNDELKNFENYVVELKKSLSNKQLKTELVELQKELEKLNQQKSEITKSIDEKNKIISDLDNQIKQFVLLPVLDQNEYDKYTNILKGFEKLDFIMDEIEKLKSKDKYTEYTISDIESNFQVIKEFYENKDLSSKKKDELTKELEKLKLDKKSTREKQKLIDRDIEEYMNLHMFFGKNGVQKQQIQKLLKQIELETNGIISRFFPDISVQFTYDKKGIDLIINRRVYTNSGSVILKPDTLKNFSDAQQEVLTVLLKLSFSKIVQHLNNVPLNVLFLNETFNKLSKDKESELMNMLNIYNKDYHLVFITHNLDLVSNFDEKNIYRV